MSFYFVRRIVVCLRIFFRKIILSTEKLFDLNLWLFILPILFIFCSISVVSNKDYFLNKTSVYISSICSVIFKNYMNDLFGT